MNAVVFTKSDDLLPTKVPIKTIVLSTIQPRHYFDPKAMQSLIESVKRDGILQPLIVRPVGDKYELVAGERRYKAAQECALQEVPVTIRLMSDEQALQYALVENLQREDLNPIEETQGILQLLALQLGCDAVTVPSILYKMENSAKGKITRNALGISEASIIEQVFADLGRMNWQSFIRTRLPLLKLPEDILEALRAGQIEYTKAKEIAKLKSKSDRIELFKVACEESLSLSQIQEKVKAYKLEPLSTLKSRVDNTYRSIKKLKLWDNPEKQKKLETLLAQLEALIQ